MDYLLRVGNEFLPQVILFLSEATMEREMGRRIRAAGAVLRSFCRTMVMKRAEPEGKALNLPINLCSYPHLWS